MISKIYPLTVLILAGTCGVCAEAEESTAGTEKDPEIASYFFIGGELLAFVEGTPVRTSRVTQSHLYIEEEGQSRVLGTDTRIGLKNTPVLANAFIEVEDFEYALTNLAAGREEVRLLSELSFSQSMNEGEIGDIRSINPNVQDEELISQETEFREQMERQIDDLRMLEDSWSDTLSVGFTLKPRQNMQGVYVVCGLAFRNDDASSHTEQGSRLAVHYLGDFEAGVPRSFRLNKPLERFRPFATDCELFFFQGNAQPVAHTHARNLRPLNQEETTQVKAMLNEVLSN